MSPYVLEVLCRCLYLFYLHDRLQRLLRSCYSHFHAVFATYFFFPLLYFIIYFKKPTLTLLVLQRCTCTLLWEDPASCTGCCWAQVGLRILSRFFQWPLSLRCLICTDGFTLLQHISERGMYYSHFGAEKLNHGIASLQLHGKCAAKAVFQLRAPETLSLWTSLPIQTWISSLIPSSLLAPSPPKEESDSCT